MHSSASTSVAPSTLAFNRSRVFFIHTIKHPMVGLFEIFYAYPGKRTGTDEETPNRTGVLDAATGHAECRERSVVLQRVDHCLRDENPCGSFTAYMLCAIGQYL